MTLDDMIMSLRLQLSDEQSVGWPDNKELLDYLDLAVDFLSEQLIAFKDPTMKKRVTLEGQGGDRLCSDIDIAGRDDDPLFTSGVELDLPDDFVSFVGNVPVEIFGEAGRKCISYNKTPLTLYYWAKLPYPSIFEATGALPYTREHASLIVDIGRMFALNRNEYDVSQDLSILGSISQAMSVSRGRGSNAKTQQ